MNIKRELVETGDDGKGRWQSWTADLSQEKAVAGGYWAINISAYGQTEEEALENLQKLFSQLLEKVAEGDRP